MRACSLVHRWLSFCCILSGGRGKGEGVRGKGAFWVLFFKSTKPIHEGSTVISQRPDLQTPPHWGLGFNMKIYQRHKHSVHINGSIVFCDGHISLSIMSTDFIFLVSKITADDDGKHEIKRQLFLGRKAMTNLVSILKIRDITLLVNVHLFKAMFFPVRYGCESWIIKKAEYQRIDAFELWCWRRLLRVSWTTRRSNQSILKEISPERTLQGLMLKMKLQYVGHLMRRTDSLEKTLMLGKIEGKRRRGWLKMRWLDGITDLMDMSLSKLWEWWWTGKPGLPQSMESQRVGHNWATQLIWTELNWLIMSSRFIHVTYVRIPFKDWNTFHCMHRLPFAYLFTYNFLNEKELMGS